jgi:CelD/BcsL family acetyltransferase involved in cellulose biosynthesis
LLEDGEPKELQLAGRMRGALRALIPAALKIAQSYGGDFEPLEKNGLCVQCHRDWPDDPQFISQWNRLLARTPSSTVFQSALWQSAVVNEFVPAGQFRLITVRRGDELLAVLVLGLNTASMLETPGRWVSDYLDPLVDAEAGTECWEIILELLRQLWDWSISGVQLHNVRANSATREILSKIAPKLGFELEEKRVAMATHIPLPASWDKYLASLDGHERKEIRRKLRNAHTKFAARLETPSDPESIAAALERGLSHMRQAESIKADFTDEVLFGFLQKLCPRLIQQGSFFVQELWFGKDPVAWLLSLRSPNGPMIYNTSYDFAQKQWSPGVVSFALAIQNAIAVGSPVFNLLRGAEEYKRRLGAVDLELLRVTLRIK